MNPQKFIIEKNEYLQQDITAYHHCLYIGFKQPDNPDFLNHLKNTFNNTDRIVLNEAANTVVNILTQEIPKMISLEGLSDCILVCVPRSKAFPRYYPEQLIFRKAVSYVARALNITDGVDYIKRTQDTLTTHLKNASMPNSGSEPYPGITRETCYIDKEKIKNKTIILIDDIYTKTINIDEDCIQALLDAGAKNVIFYAVARTQLRSYPW